MAIISDRCPVLDARVARVIDFEGTTSRVICPEYEEMTGICRLMKRALDGAPLSRLLERISEQVLDRRNIHCDLS